MNEQTISIKDALTYPAGTPIPRIKGELVKLGERESKEGGYGPYTKQWGIIKDGNDSILFTAWKHEIIPQSHIGKIIVFRSGIGKKPTLKLESDFKDKSKRTLKVTESCHVLTEEEDTDDIPMDYHKSASYDDQKSDVQGELDRVKAKVAPQANVAPKKAIPKGGVNQVQEVRKTLMQYANLRELCDHAASFLYESPGVSAELIKDVSSCFFIQGVRDGLHLKLPNNKPLSKKEDVEASEPEMMEKDADF